MKQSILFLVILTFVSTILTVNCNELPSGWLNPDDILNYDRHNKAMKPTNNDRRNSESGENGFEVADANIDATNTKKPYNTPNKYEIFYKRLINAILKTANYELKEDNYKISLERILSTEDYEILKKINNLAPSDHQNQHILRYIDSILLKTFSKTKSDTFKENLFSITDKITFFCQSTTGGLFIGSILTVIFIYQIIKSGYGFHALKTGIFLGIFMLSYMWTYYHLVEQEEIKQMAKLHYYETTSKCAKPSTISSIFNGFFGFLGVWDYGYEGDCLKLYEARHKTAKLTVHPPRVFSEMLRFFTTGVLFPLVDSFKYLIISVKDTAPWPLNWILVCILPLGAVLFFGFFIFIILCKDASISIFHMINFKFSRRGDDGNQTLLQELKKIMGYRENGQAGLENSRGSSLDHNSENQVNQEVRRIEYNVQRMTVVHNPIRKPLKTFKQKLKAQKVQKKISNESVGESSSKENLNQNQGNSNL